MFGACGHLLDGARFAGPDLAALAPLPGDLPGGFAHFAPTGEWLAVDAWNESDGHTTLHDLGSSAVLEIPGTRGETVFAPRRAGGSIPVGCTADGLVALDGGGVRVLAVFDLAGGTARVLGAPVRAFALDPEGRRIAFGLEASPIDASVDEVLHAGRLGP